MQADKASSDVSAALGMWRRIVEDRIRMMWMGREQGGVSSFQWRDKNEKRGCRGNTSLRPAGPERGMVCAGSA